jgi:ankyrin repeat protein
MYQGRTPLFLAAGNGKEDAVGYLLALRADSDPKTVHRETPLLEATRRGHARVVHQLLAVEEVDPDAADGHQRTPLIAAALRGHAEVVKLLLAAGRVQLHARDHQGMTPLMWAAKFEWTPVVELLLSTGQLQVDFGLSELRKGIGLFGPPKLDQFLIKLLDAYKKRDA